MAVNDDCSEDAFFKKVLEIARIESGLASKQIDLNYDEELNEGQIIVGGFRPVGTFSLVLNNKYDNIENGIVYE